MTPPTPRRVDDTQTALLSAEAYWWRFCLLILALKFSLLALDPLPKIFMGDSGSYIWTALKGWIPDDRSYFYGYVIRWSSVWTGSLTSLLVLQVFTSAGTVVLLAWICRSIFELRIRLCFVLGLLCAADPLQLVWERYVMTETISLFFYVAVLHFSFLYLKHRGIRHLVIAQGLSILLIGFRMSYLLVVQVSAVLLPIMAFYPVLLATWRSRRSVQVDRFGPVRVAFVHLLTSIALMLLLHGAYKHVNGWLSRREPSYLYATGLHLLAFWAPILTPADASDQRLAQIIEQGDEFDIKDLTARNAQRYAPDHLVKRWQKVEPHRRRANEIAKETALRALRRNPLQVLDLAARTFAQYWNLKDLRNYARIDLGNDYLTPEQGSLYAERFHLVTDGRTNGAPPTLLQHYFLLSWPYCYFLLLSPILGVSAVYLVREKQLALLLLVHLVIILAVTFTFAVEPSLRYLQPASVLTLLTVALCMRALLNSRSLEGPAVSH
jgi:hypothetical protein